MLMGEGKFRQELGETLVIITRHGTACALCQPFEGKVLIDDVYSGGTWENSKEKYEQVAADKRGSVQLLSEAMQLGLFHPNCRHGVGTYYVELQKEHLRSGDVEDIIKSSTGLEETIRRIENPIEQRRTGKGNPNAILTFGIGLNKRQKMLLELLPQYDSRAVVKKKYVSMIDLSALTAETGSEFAMFTKGGERLIIRGDEFKVNVNEVFASELCKLGYKWSGHTHPGSSYNVLNASDGDYAILGRFEQSVSAIYNSKGQFLMFDKGR